MIKKIDHMVITTAEPLKCTEFYEKLGFSCRDAGGRYVLFAGDFKINVHIRGKELLPHAQNVQPGSGDICFELQDDMQAFITVLEKNGIKTELGPVRRTGVRGDMSSVYLRDPDGNLLEFCSYM